MTPEQIKTLIDQKIAGQGSMVDVGGALPTILKEIVDMAESINPILAVSKLPDVAEYDMTVNEVAEELGITNAQLDKLMAGDIISVKTSDGNTYYCCRSVKENNSIGIAFFYADADAPTIWGLELVKDKDGKYSFNEF